MKKLNLLIIITVCSFSLFAQVGIGTTTPHPSSILHLNSTVAGLLVPRLTAVQKLTVPSPATGLFIYQTDGAAGFWYFNGTAWVPFGGSNPYTFNNGLTLTGSNAQLGGSLVKSTTLDLLDYGLTIRTSSASAFPGEFTIQGENRRIMHTSFKKDYVQFGGYAFLGSTIDGTTLTTTGGVDYPIDVVAGFQSDGAIGGSAIRMGSVEYIIDGSSELYVESPAGFHPSTDQTSSFGCTLGSANKRWATLYANNGVIQTSDIRFKKNIKPLKYGLNEVLKLNTITYNWKESSIGKTVIPDDQNPLKIGFSAQQLLEVIPEVVETHSWVPNDEEGNFKRIENDKLGVNYSELIPVLVNAIQELQNQINELKVKIKLLEKN